MLLPRVLLLMLISSVSFAQSPPPLVPAPEPTEQHAPPTEQTAPPTEQTAPPTEQTAPPAEQPAPPGELIPHQYEPELAPDPSISAGRVMLELLGGALGGAGGIVIGGLVSGLLFAAAGGCDDASAACGLAALVVLVPSIAIGTALGVSIFGGFLDGEGLFSSTLFGLAAGVGVGLLAGVVTASADVLVVGLIAGPLIGAVAGYEISHAQAVEARLKNPKKKKRAAPDSFTARPGFQWNPILGTTSHGGLFGGLTGRF